MEYKPIKELGKGAQGSVYLATNKEGKKVIIKKIYNRISAMQEQKIASIIACRHPNLLCLLDYFITRKGVHNLVYEYIDNVTDLFTCIFENQTSQHWSDITTLSIMYSLCKGLQFLHSNDILHLDLKPENIIIKDNNTPVIIDYDIACFEEECDNKGTRGTYGYMAPEMICGDHISSKSDVFSLGCVFYALLVENLPSEDVIELTDVDTFNIIKLKSYEKEIDQLLFGMLEIDPDKRYSLDEVIEIIHSIAV